MKRQLPVFIAASAILLSGCAASSQSQPLEVTYAGSTHAVTVANAECTFDDTTSSMSLPNEGDAVAEWGLPDFKASIFGAAGSAQEFSLMVRIGDGVFFQSSSDFELTDAGFSGDDLAGTVFVWRDEKLVEVVDREATLSATVNCP